MYSHSLRFGKTPAFRTGCTAVVDACFEGNELGSDGVLIDITLAQAELEKTLCVYDHKDLDELQDFASMNTTVEVVARAIFQRYFRGLSAHSKSLATVTRLEITVHESDVARASYFEENPSGLFICRA
mmetsp:Transcript_8708/g.13408  ORF Transcript_8708/g.13408 Transcript_8708/m.13408 type:complete len:128 (+) Transcript_8708:54-437(+)